MSSGLPYHAMQMVRDVQNREKYGASGGEKGRGILTDIKVSELPAERIDEFSNAPFEFEETAKWLWEDTQTTYYHACTENRFSENYLKLCAQLEKNIRQVGSFCLTKAVLEQKEMKFSGLDDLNIEELVRMVSFHLRKCHAAFQGIYQDNNFLGMSYLNWEFRWFELGNRLKATEVKIRKIRSGELNADSMLMQAQTFEGQPRTNDRLRGGLPKSLRVNPSALPLRGAIARDMLRREKEAAKEQLEKQKQEAREEREMLRDLRENGFAPPAPFRPERLPKDLEKTTQPVIPKPAPQPDPRFEATEESLSEAEVRKKLIEDAMRRGDQKALMTIPLEDPWQLRERWLRYIGVRS